MGRSGKRQRTYISGASWNWIRTGELKEETEGLSFAAQDQAPRTNAVKENVSFKCRMCGNHDETVQHILGNCSKLRLMEYKKRLLGGSYIGRRARNVDLSAMTK